jgi:hypothetical protein
MTETFPVGYFLASKTSFYRVIGAGSSHIDVIEYNGHDEPMYKTLSLIHNEWFKWTKDGIGEKVVLKQVAPGSPTSIPHPLRDFRQLKETETMVIQGVPYVVSHEEPTLSIPSKWQNPEFSIINLGRGLICLQTQKVKTLYDKPMVVEFLRVDGTIVKLKETDIWIFVKPM